MGCQKNVFHPFKTWMSDTGRVKVLCTTNQVADLVSEVGGERIDNWILIQGALNPHSYELVKGDGEKFERADLVFCNGLGLEHGASLSSWLRSSEKVVAVGNEILKRRSDRVLYRDGEIDPHIWMDVSLWEQTIDPIVEKLSQFDPEGASYYRQRGDALHMRMQKVHQELIGILHRVPSERRYLVTSHDAFHYFTRAYLSDGEEQWAERFAAPEGLAPDGQLSTRDIQRILEFLQATRTQVLFPESNVSRDSIRKIILSGKEMGLSLHICEETLYGDAMDGENLTYLDMMRHNAEVVSRNLYRNQESTELNR